MTVEEPDGDFVLGRVLNDGDDTLELFGGEVAGAAGRNVLVSTCGLDGGRMEGFVGDVPLVEIHVRLLADQIAVAAADTLDFGQGVHDLLFAIDLQPFVSIYRFLHSPHQFSSLHHFSGFAKTYVGVEQTQDELEVRLLARNERHLCGWWCCRCRGDGVRSLVCGFRGCRRCGF